MPTRFAGGFSTPSGNIVCQLEAGYTLCKAKDQPWKDVPKTERCDKGWRTTVELRLDTPASLRGDCQYVVFEGITPPLPYGQALQVGRTRCVSLVTELQCLVVGTQRGFVVSRSSYRLTAPTSGLAVAAAPPSVAGAVIVAPAGFHGGFGFGFDGGGLQCDQDSESVTCLVNRASWKPPQHKPPCGTNDGDPSPTVDVRKGVGRAFEDCRFDANNGGPDLAPGHGIRIGSIECLSRPADLKCTDRRTGHGFVVGKAQFRAF